MVYMSKVPDASTADGSTGWFKVFEDSWSKKSGGGSGDNDNWGTKDLNACCGKLDVKIPSDLAPGDYLLRAEVIALHTAGSSGGAQLYMSCYQLTVSGTGSATPATVRFPGAYKASDPGILVNIHAALSTYVSPGPAVYAGGTSKVPGSACTGCAATCKAGAGKTGTVITAPAPTSAAGGDAGNSGPDSTSGTDGCQVQAFGQCGGNGYSGCTSCGVSIPSPSSKGYKTVGCWQNANSACVTEWLDLQGCLAAILFAVRLCLESFGTGRERLMVRATGGEGVGYLLTS